MSQRNDSCVMKTFCVQTIIVMGIERLMDNCDMNLFEMATT